MCQFETPNFVYFSYAAVIILTLITGFSILLKDPKHPTNRNAFYFILIVALWIFDDLLQWTLHDSFWNMFFARVSYMSDLIVLFFLFFTYHFTYTKISLKKKFLLSIPYILLAILGHSSLAFRYFDINTCDYVGGPLLCFALILDVVYMYLVTRVLMRYYRNPIIPLVSRRQTRLLIFAGWFFVIWSVIYETIGMIDASDITPYYIVGNLFFVSLIAFAIIKKDLFEFRNTLTSLFVVFLWILLFAGLLFFATTPFVFGMCAIAYVILMILFFKM